MQVATDMQQVILNLPSPLYRQVRRTAESLQRSVEDVLLDTVATALPPLEGLPQDAADDLVGLAFLNDAELWRVARSTLPPEHHQLMDEFLSRKAEDDLDISEEQTLDRLLAEYETLILRRGQAAVLLQRRGYDMSDPSVLDMLA